MKVTQKIVASVNHAIQVLCPSDYFFETINKVLAETGTRGGQPELLIETEVDLAIDMHHTGYIEQSSVCISAGILYALEAVVEKYGQVAEVTHQPFVEVKRSKDRLLVTTRLEAWVPREGIPYTGTYTYHMS